MRSLLLASMVAIGEAAQAADAPADMPNLAGLHATREKPLFAPTRRPPPPIPPPAEEGTPAPPGPAPELPPPALEISGVVMGDDLQTALVRDPNGSAILHLNVGSQIDGWVVAEIHRRDIVIRKDGRNVTISMPESRN